MSQVAPRRIRPAAVAGSFYPARRAELQQLIAACFDDARRPPELSDRPPKALVVPHAGLVYSGPIAASAYALLAATREQVRRVVLIGPSHRVPLRGMGVSSVDAFETPLGLVAVDAAARDLALTVPGVVVDDTAHALEHSLEVQLPFLQTVLEDFSVLPIVTGPVSAPVVRELLDALWGGPETLIVISTDLSHYHRHADAAVLDRATAAAVVAGRGERIGDARSWANHDGRLDACGVHALRGLLASTRERRLGVDLVDLRSSGDTAGDRDRVVGYGAFAVA